jgi:hypothetical protein
MDSKPQALAYLQALEAFLRSELCAPEEMRAKIPELMSSAKTDLSRKHLGNNPEAAFLNGLVAPLLFRHMQSVPGISANEARQSLVSDYWHSMPEFCSQSSARTAHYLFSKQFGGESAFAVMARWRGERGKILRQPYPDFGFRPPFPHKILFEGKYFSGGNAENALVTAIWETCFYRGLPFIPATPVKPAWDYEFGCLIAYDASDSGNLAAAWDSVIPKAEFWDSANIYVMILGHDCHSRNGQLISTSTKVGPSPAAAANPAVRPAIVAPTVSRLSSDSEMVTVHVPGARETPTYIMTPPLGGRERWFEKRRGITCTPHPDGGLVVSLPRSELASRGLLFLLDSAN